VGTKILRAVARDIRFPTSRSLDGSDAMNPDPDYSAAYVVLETDHPDGLAGHGLTFTVGRGNELCVAAVELLAPHIVGRTLEDLTHDLRGFWRSLVADTQLRWLGPEKGVVHLATAALVNAVWDLYAKLEKKPLWKLLADMSPEQLVACIDFRYIEDALTPQEATHLLRRQLPGRAKREQEMLRDGFPAYTTSAGWIGYSDEKITKLAHEAMAEGFTQLKLKVGGDPASDLRRARILREAIGPDRQLMVDANQVWGVDEAIEAMRALAEVNPWWIEEPTSPDDVLGHLRIREVQAAAAGWGDRLLPGGQLSPGRRQRGARRAADGREVWRAGVPACRRGGPLRVRPAPGDLRLHRGQRVAGEPDLRVRRPPARALRPPREG